MHWLQIITHFQSSLTVSFYFNWISHLVFLKYYSKSWTFSLPEKKLLLKSKIKNLASQLIGESHRKFTLHDTDRNKRATSQKEKKNWENQSAKTAGNDAPRDVSIDKQEETKHKMRDQMFAPTDRLSVFTLVFWRDINYKTMQQKKSWSSKYILIVVSKKSTKNWRQINNVECFIE